MNKIYKVVWSRAKQCYVVVSELAKNSTKGAQSKKLLAAVMAAGTMSAGIGGIITAGDAAAAPATVENINIKDKGDVYGIEADGSDVTENVANGITVESTGIDKSHVAEGIFADNSGTTKVETKTISATVANGYALGVDAENSSKNDVTFTGDGAIDVKGEYAYGIYADSNANNIINKTDDNSGLNSITASGTEQGTGVGAWDGSQNDVTFTGNGTIYVKGNYAYGIEATNANNIINKTDDNSGLNSVTASGTERAFGVGTWGGGTNTVNMVDIKDAEGNSKAASITAEGKERVFAVISSGTDSTTGKASSNTIGEVGSIKSSTTDGNAYGITASYAAYNTISGVTEGMTVDVDGATAIGISAQNAKNEVTNLADYEGLNAIDVKGENYAAGVSAVNGSDTVTAAKNNIAKLNVEVNAETGENIAYGVIAVATTENASNTLTGFNAINAKAASGDAIGVLASNDRSDDTYTGNASNNIELAGEDAAITASGTDYVYAVDAYYGGTNMINNSTTGGKIAIDATSTGSDAESIGVNASGTNSTNTISEVGSITSSAEDSEAYGIAAMNLAFNTVTGVADGMSITATGKEVASGIYAYNANNEVKNMKNVTVSADKYAEGIESYGNGTNKVQGATDGLTLNATKAEKAAGINADGAGTKNTVTNLLGINVSSGDKSEDDEAESYASGIDASNSATNDITVLNGATATIKVDNKNTKDSDGEAYGIIADGATNLVNAVESESAPGTYSANADAGKVAIAVTSTGVANGIYATNSDEYEVDGTNTVSGFSSISVSGNKTFGVQADQGINKVNNQPGDTTALTIDVTSTGDGYSAHGIMAKNAGQNSVSNLADADSAKAIQVQANGSAFGISSYKGSQNNVTAQVTSEEGAETTEYAPASIEVTSNGDADNNGYSAVGVLVYGDEQGEKVTTNTVNGINSITVSADGLEAGARGILAYYGNNNVNDIGSIDVNGTGAGSDVWGIVAEYGNNKVTAAGKNATLSVKSTASEAVEDEENYAAGVQADTDNDTTATNELTGFNAINVTTVNGEAYGVLASGNGASNTVQMAGTNAAIQADGTDEAFAVYAEYGGVNVINNGTTGNKIEIKATATGDDSYAAGIYAEYASSQNTVSDVASISATAKDEADGVVAWDGGTNTIKGDTITISATASNTDGEAYGLGANAGTINITGDTLNVTAKNAIYEANGGVVNLGKAKTETEDANTPAVTVTGDIVLKDSASTLYDYGSLTQTGDVYNAGTITVDGDAYIEGDVNNTGTINLNGATSNEITGTLANDGTTYTNNRTTIGNVTGSGTTQVNDGAVYIPGAYTQGTTTVGDTIGETESARLGLYGDKASVGVVTVNNDGMVLGSDNTAFAASSIDNAGIVGLLGTAAIDENVGNTGIAAFFGNTAIGGDVTNTGEMVIGGDTNTVAGKVINDGILGIGGNTTLQSTLSGTGETQIDNGTTTVQGNFAQSIALLDNDSKLDLQGDVNTISEKLIFDEATDIATAKLGGQTTLNTASGVGIVEVADNGTTTATNMGTSDTQLGTVKLDTNSTLHITDTANIDTVNGTNAAASKLVLNTDNYLKGQMNIGQNGGITGTGVSFADTSTSPLDKAKDHDAIYASLVNKDGSMNENATLKGLQDSVVKINEGLVAGEMDINYDANGGISSVAEKTNQHNQSLVDALSASNRFSSLEMNDIRKRLGDVRLAGAESGIWTRFENGKLSGQGTDTKFNKYQIGYDRSVSDKWRLGGAVSYTKGTTDFNYGSNDLSTTSGALYGVYTGNNGLFGDVILRYGQEKTDVSFNNGVSGSISTPSYAVSGEIGKTYQLPNNTFIEPQAEIAYTHSNGDSFNDYSAYYDLQDVKSMTARLGVAYGYKAPDNKGLFYTKLSGVHEFLGESELNVHSDLVGSRTITNNAGGTWLEWSLGGQLFTSKSTYLYADIERTFGADINEDYRFNFGMRYNF